MNDFMAEFIGTAILVILGNGVVANVLLNRTKGNGAGWIVITFGWGMAVFAGVWCAAEVTGAHLNPAVTIAAAVAKRLPWGEVPGYVAAQMLGAIVGAVLVYVHYNQHFKVTDEAGLKLACFSTGPNIRSFPTAIFCEVLGTFVLILPILLSVDPSIALDPSVPKGQEVKVGLGALGGVPVGLLVLGIGLSLGGTTGYAINPARDLGPRIAHAFLPIPGKGSSDWEYAWIPVVGPIVGGVLAALTAMALGK